MPQISFDQNNNPVRSKKRILILLLVAVIVIGTIGLLIFYKNKNSSGQTISAYSSVFLNNGQVYFGKLSDIKNNYLILSDVYYIQPSINGQQDQSNGNIALVKLGNEIHGPTSQMFINSSNVLFYEHLRSDSKVVESIQSSK